LPVLQNPTPPPLPPQGKNQKKKVKINNTKKNIAQKKYSRNASKKGCGPVL
jgi:hypothetical protein